MHPDTPIDLDVELLGHRISIADKKFTNKLAECVVEIAEDLQAKKCIISQDYSDRGYEYTVKLIIVLKETSAKIESEYLQMIYYVVEQSKQFFSTFCQTQDAIDYGWKNFTPTKHKEGWPDAVVEELEYQFHCTHPHSGDKQ